MAVEREILEFHGLCDHGCGPARIRHSQTVKGRKYPTALLCESCDREHWLQSDHKPTTADQKKQSRSWSTSSKMQGEQYD